MADNDPRRAWAQRMQGETETAEAAIEAGDSFAPHDGQETDLNIFAADMLAEPDPSFDPTLEH